MSNAIRSAEERRHRPAGLHLKPRVAIRYAIHNKSLRLTGPLRVTHLRRQASWNEGAVVRVEPTVLRVGHQGLAEEDQTHGTLFIALVDRRTDSHSCADLAAWRTALIVTAQRRRGGGGGNSTILAKRPAASKACQSTERARRLRFLFRGELLTTLTQVIARNFCPWARLSCKCRCTRHSRRRATTRRTPLRGKREHAHTSNDQRCRLAAIRSCKRQRQRHRCAQTRQGRPCRRREHARW
jgi:hypothetical protein